VKIYIYIYIYQLVHDQKRETEREREREKCRDLLYDEGSSHRENLIVNWDRGATFSQLADDDDVVFRAINHSRKVPRKTHTAPTAPPPPPRVPRKRSAAAESARHCIFVHGVQDSGSQTVPRRGLGLCESDLGLEGFHGRIRIQSSPRVACSSDNNFRRCMGCTLNDLTVCLKITRSVHR
jgi:hypothetical protein